MLHIKPLMDDGLNSCSHFLIASVANWLNCGYELMYADAWGFRFAPEGTKGHGIWQRGDLGPRIHYEYVAQPMTLLERFHGLQVKEVRDSTLDATHAVLKEELDKQRPVLIMMDTYFLPWLDKFYQQVHSSHAILVIGMDDNGDLFCNDTRPFFQSPTFGGRLTRDYFLKGYHNTYSTFTSVPAEMCSLSACARIVKHTALKMISRSDSSVSPVNAIKEFANHIEHNPVSLTDLEDFDGGNGILFRGIRNIIRDRINFSKTLAYIGHTFGSPDYMEMADSFKLPIENWENFKAVLYRSYLSGTTNEKRGKLASILNENAEIEEKLAHSMLK